MKLSAMTETAVLVAAPWVVFIVAVFASPQGGVSVLVSILAIGAFLRSRMALSVEDIRARQAALPVKRRRQKHYALLLGGASFCLAGVTAFFAPLAGLVVEARSDMSLTMSVLLTICGAYFVYAALKKLRVTQTSGAEQAG